MIFTLLGYIMLGCLFAFVFLLLVATSDGETSCYVGA